MPEAASQSLAVLSALAVRIRVTVGTKRRIGDPILMVKRADQLPGGRIPKLGGFVCAPRQDPSAVPTERRAIETILMRKRGDGFATRPLPRV